MELRPLLLETHHHPGVGPRVRRQASQGCHLFTNSYDKGCHMRLFNLWPYNVNELSKLIRKLTQQATFFGLLIGVIFAGLISDRFGRIPSMLFLTGKEIGKINADSVPKNDLNYMILSMLCNNFSKLQPRTWCSVLRTPSRPTTGSSWWARGAAGSPPSAAAPSHTAGWWRCLAER